MNRFGLRSRAIAGWPVMGLAFGVVVWGQIAGMPVWAADAFETPPVLNAADVVPEALLSGPEHAVADDVVNDGYINTYIINSQYGQFTAVGNAMLEIRVREIYALEAMAKTQQSDAYKGAAEAALDGMVAGATNLVNDPVGSVKGAVSGVAKLFNRASEAVVGTKSQAQDSTMQGIIGFSKAKRQIAYEFDVDAYSSNPVLQERLDEIAWAGFAGGATFSLATAMVPGAGGVLLTGVNTTGMMNEIFRTTSPEDLRIMNREKLRAMGISKELTDLFVDNAAYTPRQQTLLVFALDEMSGVADRSALIKVALFAPDQEMAFFRQRYAEMLAGYHRNVSPFGQLTSVGPFVLGRTADNKVVATVPLDHLVWTQAIAVIADDLNSGVDGLGDFKAKELWLEGSLSASARRNLEGLGWSVREQSGSQLYRR